MLDLVMAAIGLYLAFRLVTRLSRLRLRRRSKAPAFRVMYHDGRIVALERRR